ncbi:hypothetical protein E0H38_15445 [Rhizobium leguminosarum bv. viciae]|nr:hypothetical protein E0H32_32920 [Rhizobium leguminosarum bv. viciae]TBZ17432.1 hypothetical protein E0H38_15445 [Rhizobium leguminosarum bv. viciae]
MAIGRRAEAIALERFSFSRKRRIALTFCFYAIPDGKPLRTFPGIALARLPLTCGDVCVRTGPSTFPIAAAGRSFPSASEPFR